MHFNRRQPETPRVTVVVFNLQAAWIKGPEWNETVRTMRPFEASEYVYFYALTNAGALLPVHALPNANSDSPPANAPWIAKIVPPFEAMWSLDQPRHLQDMRVPFSPYPPTVDFNPYRELVARLAPFPGRKNLVCINCLFAKPTHFDSSPDAVWNARAADLRQMAEALRQARIAVYPVGGKPANNQVQNNKGPLPIDQIGAFAEVTGGRVYGTGEIQQAIRDAVADGRSTYRIGYLPGPENWDGKRHKIRAVSTRSGVHLLAFKWYAAGLLEDIAREWKPPIPEIAITSPFDLSDIAISVSPDKVEGTLRLHIHVDAADVVLLPRNGRYAGSLTMQALCYTPEGRRMACTEPLRVKLDLSEQERATAMKGGLRFPLDVPTGEVSSRIRVVVHDESSGASGSSTFAAGEMH